MASDGTLRRSVADTPTPVLDGLLHAATRFVDLLSQPDTVQEFDLDGSQLVIGWNHDPTTDRDNGQWWDKRMHWHLNVWPAHVRNTVRPVPLHSITSVTTRRSIVDPVAYLAHQVMGDALHADGTPLPDGCTILPPNPAHDAANGLPVGLKIRTPSWQFVNTSACRDLLRRLHTIATGAFADIQQAFTGSQPRPLPDWQRPTLLAPPQVAARLAALTWLTTPTGQHVLRLRQALRDLTPRELILLRDRPRIANRSMTLGGLSYNIAFHSATTVSDRHRLADQDGPHIVMQFKLVSYVGHSPAIGGATASMIDRFAGPVMTSHDAHQRTAFQQHVVNTLQGGTKCSTPK